MFKKIIVLVVLVVSCLVIDVEAKAKGFDFSEYVDEIVNANIMETIDDFYVEELLYNACSSVDLDGETVSCIHDEVVGVYDIMNKYGVHFTHVVLLHDGNVVDVDTDACVGTIIDVED